MFNRALWLNAMLFSLFIMPVFAGDFDPMRNQVYRGSLYRDGVFESSGLPELSKVKWKFKTGAEVKSSPIVVDGILYVGSWDGYMYAINPADGTEIWKYDAGARVSAPPCVAYGTLFFPSENRTLHALDPKTGEVRWTKSEYTKRSWVQSKPSAAVLPVAGLIIAQSGSSEGIEAIAMSMNQAVALDPQNGDKVLELDKSQAYDALATDGRLVVSNSSDLSHRAFDIQAKKRRWSERTPAYSRSGNTAAIRDGKVIIIAAQAGIVQCRELETGKLIWEKSIYPEQRSMQDGGILGYEIIASPAFTEELVVVPCFDGNLYGLNAKDGEIVWTYPYDSTAHSSPSVADGVVYFGDFAGKLHAVDLKTGKGLWAFQAGGRIITSPWPGDGVIYFGCDDGYIYALE